MTMRKKQHRNKGKHGNFFEIFVVKKEGRKPPPSPLI